MDLTTPTLTLTSPQPGSVLKGIVKLEALASDDTAVDRVEFWIDGSPVLEKIAPYSASFDTNLLSKGDHTIYAVAFDSSGNKSQTVVVSFKVDNSVILPPSVVDTGWTKFSPPVQSVYVSQSGSDSNDGLSEAHPVKTLAKAYSLLHAGNKALLLKRGDVWREAFPYWAKSGLSADKPLLISAYGVGTERPIVSCVSDENVLVTRSAVSFVAVVGLRLTNLNREPGQPGFNAALKSDAGVRWQSTGQFLLLEDCQIDFHGNGVVSELSGFKDLRVRRSVIANNWNKTDVHSQGLFIDSVRGFLLEENFIDNNGWSNAVPGAGATMFNHGCYVQTTTTGAVVRNNIFSRSSATGIQMRTGGECSGNFFVQNPIALTFGFVLGGSLPVAGGVSGEIKNNFFLEGNDMSATSPRGVGISLGNILKASVHDNFFANRISLAHGSIEVDCGNGIGVADQGLTIANNIFWKWQPAISFTGSCAPRVVQSGNVSAGVFPKPDQVLASYDKDFFAQARKQSRLSWNPKYTAVECLKFFKAGFGR